MKPASRDVYAWSACVLLVSLGLGILYLVILERLSVGAGLAAIGAGIVLIPALAGLRDYVEESRRQDDFSRYRHPPPGDEDGRERGET